MDWKEIGKKIFSKKDQEPEVYTPQREYIDRRHDNLQRQLSFYQKKRDIPIMEAKIKALENEVYGNGFKTTNDTNIMKTPNHFKDKGGILKCPNHFKSKGSMLKGRGIL